MAKLKVGVIGVGYLGSIHARIYSQLQTCSLVGVCDSNPERLNAVAQQLDIPGYYRYQDLLDKVDAVSIAVPTKLHYQVACDFLKRKVHVLVEKPFTTDLRQAANLIKMAKKYRLILQVGHIERFNSAFVATKRIIKNPQFIECHRLSPFPNRSLDIGVVLDLMIHDIDIVLGLVNSGLKKVESVGVSVLSAFEDIANARITFKNGCVANLTASRVSDEVMRKIRIFQKDTYISLDYKEASASVYKKAGSRISKAELPIEKEQPLQKELSSFLTCVAGHTPPLVSGEIAAEALGVALKIKSQIWQKNKS